MSSVFGHVFYLTLIALENSSSDYATSLVPLRFSQKKVFSCERKRAQQLAYKRRATLAMHGCRSPTTKHQPQHHQAQKLPASDVGSVTSDLCVRAFAATVSIKLRFSLTNQYLPRRKHPSRLSKRRSALCHAAYEFSELFLQRPFYILSVKN